MIKGVNKKVIEINRPDSAYFERAVLYLKPDVLKYTNEYTVKSKSFLLHPLSLFLTHPSRVSYCC